MKIKLNRECVKILTSRSISEITKKKKNIHNSILIATITMMMYRMAYFDKIDMSRAI